MLNKIKVGKFSLALLFGVVLFAVPTPSYAVVVNHNEQLDGDINFNTFVFDVGENRLIGNTLKLREVFQDGSSTTLSTDLDVFFFSTLPGQEVTSITYEFANVLLNGPTENFGSDLTIKTGFNGLTLGVDTVIVTNNTSPLTLFENSLLPLEASDLFWDQNHRFSRPSDFVGEVGGSWDYVLTFTVSEIASVPEPNAILLVGAGILGIAGTRRRRKAK